MVQYLCLTQLGAVVRFFLAARILTLPGLGKGTGKVISRQSGNLLVASGF
jgi:hypothetical protein